MKVQIDFELFCELFRYFHQKRVEDGWASDIYQQIESKMDKIVAHDLFTKYKRAATPEEREAARNEYLNFKGIHKSFRTEKEERGL